MSVIATVEQTAGRGQGTHTWYSTKGLNLTFSMLFNPRDLVTDDMLLITCATTLGLRDYLLVPASLTPSTMRRTRSSTNGSSA